MTVAQKLKCCDTGQIEDTRQKRLQMLGRAEVTQTLSHPEQSSQYTNNSKGILMQNYSVRPSASE